MDNPELSNAVWWASFWDTIESWAFLGVVVALAIEFAAHKFVVPHKRKIEAAQAQQLADTQVEAGRLRLALEAANAETAQIKAGLTSRHVLASQRALIVSLLRGKNIRVEVATWSPGGPEVSEYAGELALTFHEAGVGPGEFGENTIIPGIVGLIVRDAAEMKQSEVANALAAAQVDFEYQKIPTSAAPTPVVRVLVGARKNPF